MEVLLEDVTRITVEISTFSTCKDSKMVVMKRGNTIYLPIEVLELDH